MRRRELLGAFPAMTLLWPRQAQPAEQLRKLGVLMFLDEALPEAQQRRKALEQGLADCGWSVGRNVQIDYRWAGANMDRLRTLAKEILELKPDLIVTSSTPGAKAVLQETRTIPVVFAGLSDPVASGIVATLTRPGANATGFTNYEFSMIAKWLQLLKDAAPQMERIALLFNPSTAPSGGDLYWKPFAATAPSLSVERIAAAVHSNDDIEKAIEDLGREPRGGLVVPPDIFNINRSELIISSTARHRVPAIYPFTSMARRGGLMAYGADEITIYRQAGSYIDRILKGESPSDLPVQAPTSFQLAVNLKVAKALDLSFSASILAHADEVIE